MKKIIVAVIVIVAFSFLLGTAKAQDTGKLMAEIRARIAELLGQVSSLQSQLKKLEAQEPERWCHTFSVDMGVGVGGEEVAALYRALQQDTGTLPPDVDRAAIVSGGIFTEATAAMVSEFQLKYADEVLRPLGLPSTTGYVGKGTRAKLNQLYGCKKPIPTPAPQSSNINILAPAGGDEWVLGSKQKIRWQYNPSFLAKLKAGSINSISIDIHGVGRSYVGHILRMDAVYGGEGSVDTSRLVNFTSYDWNVGEAGPPPGGFGQTFSAEEAFRIIPDQKYQVRVCGGMSETFSAVCDKSPVFAIVRDWMGDPPALPQNPKISKLSPSSGPVGTQVTITGSGLGGKIMFGDGLVLAHADSDLHYSKDGGKTLTFFVPSALGPACLYQYPPCEIVAPPTAQGTYAVVVINDNGKSNPAMFTVTSSPTPTTVPATLNILAPRGGETWFIGGTYDVKWRTNVPYVAINLVYQESALDRQYTVMTLAPSEGAFRWIIPQLPAGRYKLELLGYRVRPEIGHATGPVVRESSQAFTISARATTLPTTCTDEAEGTPVITSISPSSGPVGTTIELRGCNFSGFEGDKNAWISGPGGSGILYGGAGGSTNNLIRATLNSPICQSDTTYSGLPCPAWLTFTPGTYTIYVMPWGKKSNEVSFTIR